MSDEGIRFVSREEQARKDAEERPLGRNAVTPVKVRVLLSEGKGMAIDWADGHKSAWSFVWLRDACPCATCVEERKVDGRHAGEAKPRPAQLLPMYAPKAKPLSAKGVGHYAIEFEWNDGHRSGIYSWEYLRRNCQCSECTFARAETQGTPN